jgi:uncharacterized iron-regulated membrane protein
MKPLVLFRKLHKWLGLIIGLQVLFWVLGGLIMSALDIDKVHGDHLRKTIALKPVNLEQIQPITKIAKQHQLDINQFQLVNLPHQWQYHIRTPQGQVYFFDATTGEQLKPISQEEAVRLAKTYYKGEASIATSSLINQHSTEYRKALPAWRIEFDDSESATFYLAANTGELMSVRTTRWRLFDFVWMLHIMDYKDRSDFNHPLLIFAAFLALLISISGLYLVVKTFKKRDFGLKK